MVFCITAHLVWRADTESNITLWELGILPIQTKHQVTFEQPKLETSIRCQWNSLKNLPPSIYDEVCVQLQVIANFCSLERYNNPLQFRMISRLQLCITLVAKDAFLLDVEMEL